MSVDFMLKQVLESGLFSRFRQTTLANNTRALLLERLLLAGSSSVADAAQMADLPLEDVVQRPGDVELCAHDANVLYFCDRLCEEFGFQSDIDPALFDHFQSLRPWLAAFLLTHEDALYSLRHPLFELLDQWWLAARYWSVELGKQGDKYRARLDDFLQQLNSVDPVSGSVAELGDNFINQTQKDLQRATLLANRLCETERSALASQNAEHVVRRQVNALLLRTDMPEVLIQFFKEPLKNSLQMIFLAHGANSDKWQAAVYASQCLQDSMLPPQDDEQKQRSYKLIPLLPDMLRHSLVSIGDPAAMEEWLEQIEALHMRILLGQTVELQPAEPLLSLSEDTGVSTNVSAALLEQVALIPVDSWIVYQRENGEAMRCRLVLKLDEAGQMLFVNVLGVKCLEKTFEEFAYLLSVRQIRLMDNDARFSLILNEVSSQLIQLYEKQSLLQANLRDREAREEAVRQRARDKARLEAEEIERQRMEAERRLAEQARVLEEQRKAVEAMETAARAKLQVDQSKRQERENALQLAHALGVGAWLELDIDGTRQKCKLAAVINSTDKLIFTNREGRKVTETTRSDMVDMLLTEMAVVIEVGSQFESSLQKVIQSLRKD